MREIINDKQALILAALESRVDARHDDLKTLTGLKDQSYQRPMNDLRERGLVEEKRAGDKHILRFAINKYGRKALVDHERHQREIAAGITQSAKINVMHKDYPTYSPKPWCAPRPGAEDDMKIKVSEASNLQLDWMVAKCLGANVEKLTTYDGTDESGTLRKYLLTEGGCTVNYCENWAQGGPIIEQAKRDRRAARNLRNTK